MDRRTFLSGAGTAGTLGAVATGLALRETGAARARASGLARAAGAGQAGGPVSMAGVPAKVRPTDGLTLGYLPGSAGMFATPTVERLMRQNATGLRWARWDAATAQANRSAVRTLFKVSSLVYLSIGVLRRAVGVGAGPLAGLDITAHFAIDDAPYFAPFAAWSYEAAGIGTPQKSTQPISFSARIPERVALEVSYALAPGAVATGLSSAGSLHLPIGADAATGAGLGMGLYVLATPSASSGVQPDLSTYVFSGDVHAPLADPAGRALDFDYLTLAIRPAAV